MTKEDVAKLKAEIETSLAQAKSIEDLNSIKVKYLGKKGFPNQPSKIIKRASSGGKEGAWLPFKSN
jgi:hypothetical protein